MPFSRTDWRRQFFRETKIFRMFLSIFYCKFFISWRKDDFFVKENKPEIKKIICFIWIFLFFLILSWKGGTKEHLKKFNLRLNWDGLSFEQVLRFSPKFFSARTADAKRARRLVSWSSKTVTIKCYFLDYSNLEQIIKKFLKSYIDLKNLIT